MRVPEQAEKSSATKRAVASWAPIFYERCNATSRFLFRNDAIEFLEAREFSVIDRGDHVTPLYGSGIGGQINALHHQAKAHAQRPALIRRQYTECKAERGQPQRGQLVDRRASPARPL